MAPTPPSPTATRPDQLTDRDLRIELTKEASQLLVDLGPVAQASFGPTGARDDARWHHAMPTTVEMHVRGLFMMAGDSFGIACIGQHHWASAASLAPLRHLAESLVQLRWLLEPDDEVTRRARAYALTNEAIDGAARIHRHLRTSPTDEAAPVAVHTRDAIESLRQDLDALRQVDSIPVVHIPNREQLFSRFAPEIGYLQFALLSTIGSHPGALQSTMFYVDPGQGRVNYDFQGASLEIDRAYWVVMAIRLFIDACRLSAPVLAMSGWEPLLARAATRVDELEPEANRRWIARRSPRWPEIL